MGQTDGNAGQTSAHFVSKMDLGKSEHFECRAGESDGRLNVFLQELLHVHPKERPHLLQHLDISQKK